ncbi:glycine cleavage system H protein, mitochondrial [Pelomyxa schiedti]|nr:glycine cleavage system H protein, mitochondrial [Pelomyxa schiedti]
MMSLCYASIASPRFSLCYRSLSGTRYTKTDEWIKVDGDKGAYGITDHAQHALGDLVFVELPAKGAKLAAKATAGTVESVKTVSEVFAPMTGEVVEVNTELSSQPTIINKDAEGQGWIAKLKLTKLDEFESLLTEEQYKKHCEENHH